MAFHPVELVDRGKAMPAPSDPDALRADWLAGDAYAALMEEWPDRLIGLLYVTRLLEREGFALNDDAVLQYGNNEIGFVALLQSVGPIEPQQSAGGGS